MTDDDTCLVQWCQRKPTGRGWCHRHYYRWRVTGDPESNEIPWRATHAETTAFIELAVASEATDCIIWPFSLSEGYGQYKSREFPGERGAHRVALIMADGHPTSTELQAAHDPEVCTSRACINPRHLRWATPADNNADMDIRGSRNVSTTIPWHTVLEIRADDRPLREVAEDYGTSIAHVSRIRRGESRTVR